MAGLARVYAPLAIWPAGVQTNNAGHLAGPQFGNARAVLQLRADLQKDHHARRRTPAGQSTVLEEMLEGVGPVHVQQVQRTTELGA